MQTSIGILGAGNVARALANLLRAADYPVELGQRSDASSPDTVSFEAAATAEIVIIAIPYLACADVLPALKPQLHGKIVIDATNPLNADWSPVGFADASSAAEEIAKLLPGSHIVKAFNTVFADVMKSTSLLRGGARVSSFIASDDPSATERVTQLADSAGFAAVPVGPLRLARYLEAIAHLNIAIAVGMGGGTQGAFVFDRGAS